MAIDGGIVSLSILSSSSTSSPGRHLAFRTLAPGEGQQLADDVGAAAGAALAPVDGPLRVRSDADAFQRPAAHQDRHEDVIQVMRSPVAAPAPPAHA
ncbi:MAG TPA: hypothetical protein VGF28_19370 [Thermoanaerobaculia bacterium]|jgi:hypothetical protein